MQIAGYLASVLIGILLGLIGGGGSMLALPVLVYLFGVDPVLATADSLFIVGSTSLVAAVTKHKSQLVNFRMALIFALPAASTILLTRGFLLPSIPQQIFKTGTFCVTKPILLMTLFALLMVPAAVSMIYDRKKESGIKNETSGLRINFVMIMLLGAIVGMVTGLVGAGGGFLIIPALTVFGKMPIKTAIGTSLLVIAINSLFGFLISVSQHQVNWTLLTLVTALAIMGSFAGHQLNNKLPGRMLKKSFGWFALLMAIYIIGREFVFPGFIV
jgi:uncharacterized membrane protein YfcA